MSNLKKLRILKPEYVNKNEFWIYSAGFNVEKNPNNLSRINEELKDLKLLIKKKCRIFILTHQGDFKKKTSIHVPYLAKILKKKLNTSVKYYSGLISIDKLLILKKKINPGELILVGNTRLLGGEQSNSFKLAKIYSILANKLVLGGFSKAHRKNASNNAILKYVKAFLSNGIVNELIKLDKWKKYSKKNFIFFIGGNKKEKVMIGLKYLGKKFNYIVPSGVVLNSILKAKGYQIGKSSYFKEKKLKNFIHSFLKKNKKKLILPSRFLTLNQKKNKQKVKFLNQITKSDTIAGYLHTKKLDNLLRKCKKNHKILFSGTPSLVKKNVMQPTRYLSRRFKNLKSNILILGGDSANDLRRKKNVSSGGGSSLKYISNNRLEIITELYKNKRIFK